MSGMLEVDLELLRLRVTVDAFRWIMLGSMAYTFVFIATRLELRFFFSTQNAMQLTLLLIIF